MAIAFPPLPFSLIDLEPYMSRQTLEFHYGKHHKSYIDTLNKLIEGTPWDQEDLEEIMRETFNKEQKIYNNAAQSWNHTFFWNCLQNSGQEPSPDLMEALEKNFGSFNEFKDQFTTASKELFGSGWTWLVLDSQGDMQIRTMGNAGNPLAELDEIPLLTCDDWEHAYYLDYQNERAKYLDSFWRLVNWNFVEENLRHALENEPRQTAGLKWTYKHSDPSVSERRDI